MSAHNDSDFNKFIIKRDDSITDFFRKWDELLTSAKAERLLDYLTGKTHVKPEADVEALNKTRLTIYYSTNVANNNMWKQFLHIIITIITIHPPF
jgi:hypothetical protein